MGLPVGRIGEREHNMVVKVWIRDGASWKRVAVLIAQPAPCPPQVRTTGEVVS